MEVKAKHHGEIIKDFLQKHRIPQKKFCKNLGFAASNFDMALMREKVSAKHQLKIKEVYGIDFDNFNESDITVPSLVREKGTEYNGSGDSGSSCEKRIKDKEEIIELLKKNQK